MFLSILEIENFRCIGTGEARMVVRFQEGLTALVGANDAGKTAVIDALRFALGTSDQERQKLEETDFHKGAEEIRISCLFEKLNTDDQSTFAEFLTHFPDPATPPVLYVNWIAENAGQARAGRRYFNVETRSGRNGDGPPFPQEVRLLLNATYLRPLRDAEQALSAGRYSRLSQVLRQSPSFVGGSDECDWDAALRGQDLSLVGVAKLFTDLLSAQKGVHETRTQIDETLREISLRNESLLSKITVSGSDATDETRLKELLEKLDLSLSDLGRMGLGSDNILFMACELLLLANERIGNKMLLIEEPEAHLHAQRQLQLVRALQKKARSKGIQVILTTHSPNLASVIPLNNLVIIRGRKSFALSEESTRLKGTDREFLQRFLDATKANLFFANGVIIVEGDAENILLPMLARLIGRDFTAHGVSTVNVGGVGLGRYSRIFQRTNPQLDGELGIPVACITDLDVMPDCAPVMLGKVKEGEAWPPTSSGRKWRAKADIGDSAALEAKRAQKRSKFDGQMVNSFVSDEWTLEYNLALGRAGEFGRLAEDVWLAVRLAENDEKMHRGKVSFRAVALLAKREFKKMVADLSVGRDLESNEKLATKIYAHLDESASKPVTAQYFSQILERHFERQKIDSSELRRYLPEYLVGAIEHVTGGAEAAPAPHQL